jgi:phosphoglycolate phosphatase
MLSSPSFAGPVEFSREFTPRPGITHVLFDFDGTLSLLRSGWTEIMLDVFLEHHPGAAPEHRGPLREILLEDLLRLNGRPTIHQMIQFAERVRAAGGHPLAPEDYNREFQRRLHEKIARRGEAIRTGSQGCDDFLVRGARPFLELLRERGFTLILASGTELRFLEIEADWLQIRSFFGRHIYGPQPDDREFSKKAVMERILLEEKIAGKQLLSFGDGHVEIQNTCELGGLAVAVASDEIQPGSGRVDPFKRKLLVEAGAHIVIPDFREAAPLLDFILGK